MMDKTLEGLTNILFEQLDRINHADMSDEQFQKEVQRAKITTEIGKTLLDTARIGLDAVRVSNEYYNNDMKMPKLLSGDDQ